MVQKVHGAVAAGEMLGRNLDFYTLETDQDILAVAGDSQKRLDKLVEVISLRGQPIIMGAPSGSGPYTFKFAIEHAGAWTAATLKTAIVDHAGHLGFTAGGLTITISDTL